MKELFKNEIIALNFNKNMGKIKHIKFEDVFVSDADMVQTLAAIAKSPYAQYCKGKVWIDLAEKALRLGWTLSEKQLSAMRGMGNAVIDLLTYLIEKGINVNPIMYPTEYSVFEANHSPEVEKVVEAVVEDQEEVDDEELTLENFFKTFKLDNEAATEDVQVNAMEVVEITYTSTSGTETFTKTALVTKVTPKTIKVMTRNSELIAIDRTIKKSNIVNVTVLSSNDAHSWLMTCKDLKSYASKIKKLIN